MTKGAKWGLVWLTLLSVLALTAVIFWAERSRVMDLQRALEGPSVKHWLGTDSLGRDLFLRILSGAAVSMGVAFGALLVSMVLGVSLGLASGYFGGKTDKFLMGFTDLMLCFPSFFLLLAVVTVLGSSIFNLAVILGLTGWMGVARLVRAETLSLKERDFVLAAKVFGAGPARILFRHLFPNVAGVVMANAVLSFSALILAETGLSFLGLGVQPPAPSWGNILADAKMGLGVAWWLTVFPGSFIFLTVVSVNVLGENLRERFYS